MCNLSYSSEKAPWDYGVLFKDALFENLYVRQIDYWNRRLHKASYKNVMCYSREDSAFNNDDRSFVGLFYDGEVFGLLPHDDDDTVISPYCLEVYQGDPELIEEVCMLASQLRKFKKERYIAERFLAGLSMFEPPPQVLAKILGDGLYRICHNALVQRGNYTEVSGTVISTNFVDMHWPVSEPEALKTYVNQQQPIITAMQERVMLNMITL
jgi:hypothetical protein